MDLKHHSVLVQGIRVHWAELDEHRDATPVVLLHGLNNSHLTWKYVAPLLAGDRRVLMPDLVGHGQSERANASYELAWHAHMIAEWLEIVGLKEVDVVGHSFGGGIAQMLLLECPKKIRRLVLVASGGLGREVGMVLRLASLPRVIEYLGQPFMGIGTRLALRAARDGVSDLDVSELMALNAEPGTARAFGRSVRDVINWRGQTRHFLDRAHEVGRLPPILVLWGSHDALIPIDQGRAFATSVEGAVFKEFEGAGHYLHNERPELFVRTVREFLDEPVAVPVRLRSPAEHRSSSFQRMRDAVFDAAKSVSGKARRTSS